MSLQNAKLNHQTSRNKMPQSFFEALAVADQERIHSQMIAWMLNPKNGPTLDTAQRLGFISNAFQINIDPNEWTGARVLTEINTLDIAIIYGQNIIAIENKIKSRQGEGQLLRNDATIEKIRELLEIEGSVTKILLTLSGEVAEAAGWATVDYQALANALLTIAPSNIYINDYFVCLSNLIAKRNDFLHSHTTFPEIFQTSGMAAIDRICYATDEMNEVELFGFSNNVERMFIEALLMEVSTSLTVGTHIISESRGTALIDSRMFIFSFNEMEFRCGLQLQGRSLKLNVGAINYADSDREMIQPIEDALDAAILKTLGIMNLPAPRVNAARTKAYRSWSQIFPDEGDLCDTAKEIFVNRHSEVLAKARQIWLDVLENLLAATTIQSYTPYPPAAFVAD